MRDSDHLGGLPAGRRAHWYLVGLGGGGSRPRAQAVVLCLSQARMAAADGEVPGGPRPHGDGPPCLASEVAPRDPSLVKGLPHPSVMGASFWQVYVWLCWLEGRRLRAPSGCGAQRGGGRDGRRGRPWARRALLRKGPA